MSAKKIMAALSLLREALADAEEVTSHECECCKLRVYSDLAERHRQQRLSAVITRLSKLVDP